MIQKYVFYFVILKLMLINLLHAQEIQKYTVKKSNSKIIIDGLLNEPEWKAASLSKKFINYKDGTATDLCTQAKLLWDKDFLYIAFICSDPDVWATIKDKDRGLWKEDVVEIFCDPDGDGINYIEMQINPLGTLTDLLLNKSYFEGGKSNSKWDIKNTKLAISIDGSLNNFNDTDVKWICELAIPFNELKQIAPTQNFPPQNENQWRILLTRYDYCRIGDKKMEVSAWNQTDERGFHGPDKYGIIIFSEEFILPLKN